MNATQPTPLTGKTIPALLGLMAAVLLGSGTLESRAVPPQYIIYDLGPNTRASDINNLGQVTGRIGANGFRWSSGTLQDLGSFGVPALQVMDLYINDGGQLAGWSREGFPPYTPSAGYRDFGGGVETIPPVGNNQIDGINNSGAVVGNASNGGIFEAYRYSGTTQTFLGGLSGLSFGGNTRSAGKAINDLGDVVGYAYPTQGEQRAALFSGGSVQNLGLPAGTWTISTATGINNAGQVVGDAYNFGGGLASVGFLYSSGSMISLGTLPGFSNSNASAINASGQIVGVAGNFSASSYTTFLYEEGTMYDLASLATNMAQANFALLEGKDINDSGWIVGDALHTDGFSRAFLAVPVPEPACVGLVGMGLCIALAARRRSGLGASSVWALE